MSPPKRAMAGEGEPWKLVGAELPSRWGERDSFAQTVSEISRISVAACRGSSIRLRKK